jgi:hypothetical protein
LTTVGKLAGATLVTAWSASALAQESADELAKKLSNPVASLISVPLQLNGDFGYANDGMRWTLNVQPVIPAPISKDWNLITRIIMPIVYQDDVFPGSNEFGLGDTTPTFFFSPKAPTAGGLTWGVGPVFLLPTATDDLLGTEKWGIGPSIILLQQSPEGHTLGVLMNHIESLAGDDDRADVSNTFIQPFFAQQYKGGKTLTFNLESTYDWEHDQWTIPANVVYSKVTRIGSQMVSFAAGGRVYFEQPDGGPEWGVRFVVTLLLPG